MPFVNCEAPGTRVTAGTKRPRTLQHLPSARRTPRALARALARAREMKGRLEQDD